VAYAIAACQPIQPYPISAQTCYLQLTTSRNSKRNVALAVTVTSDVSRKLFTKG